MKSLYIPNTTTTLTTTTKFYCFNEGLRNDTLSGLAKLVLTLLKLLLFCRSLSQQNGATSFNIRDLQAFISFVNSFHPFGLPSLGRLVKPDNFS